jgi:hypothetical protein
LRIICAKRRNAKMRKSFFKENAIEWKNIQSYKFKEDIVELYSLLCKEVFDIFLIYKSMYKSMNASYSRLMDARLDWYIDKLYKSDVEMKDSDLIASLSRVRTSKLNEKIKKYVIKEADIQFDDLMGTALLLRNRFTEIICVPPPISRYNAVGVFYSWLVAPPPHELKPTDEDIKRVAENESDLLLKSFEIKMPEGYKEDNTEQQPQNKST